MITDQCTNKVYFSHHLKRYKCWENIRKALESHSVQYGILPGSKDIWVRDFMPIQIQSRSFIHYNYNPNYLKGYEEYLTADVHQCYDFVNSDFRYLDLILDGGNFIFCGDKIILTDKIFYENNSIDKSLVIKSIEDTFSAEVVIIPWDKAEPYGHADGMVRYVKHGQVVINHYVDYDLTFRKKLIHALSGHFDSINELSFGSNARNSSWAHLNFLRVGDTIFVPQLGIASDGMAIEQIGNFYEGCTITPVYVKGIVSKGGALNCVSWNIQEKSSPLYVNGYGHYVKKMYDILVQRKQIRTSISDLFLTMIHQSELSYPIGTHFLPDMYTLTAALWNYIKKNKKIATCNVYPENSDIGLPYDIPYEFYLK